MNEHRFLSSNLLSDSLPENLRTLLNQQKGSWELLRRNYESLDNEETTQFTIGDSVVRVQHNPARLASTGARVDDESVRARPCFLCADNLPVEQRALAYADDLVILCNPFPIFPEHFTVAHRHHLPQRFEPYMHTFFRLSQDAGREFVVLYNGPRCGASAPDHLHFQVGSSGLLPLEDDYERMIIRFGEKVADREGLVAFGVEAGGRRFLAIESDDIMDVQEATRAALRALNDLKPEAHEPMVNIVSWFQEGEWRVVIFPRAKHRPACYDAPEERRFLISPAAVDLAGLLIVPRAVDYHRIAGEHVRAIFEEVMLPPETFALFLQKFTAAYFASSA